VVVVINSFRHDLSYIESLCLEGLVQLALTSPLFLIIVVFIHFKLKGEVNEVI